MQIRPAQRDDLHALDEIDATIDSTEYLHVDRSGEQLAVSFKLEPRPLRERLIQANRMSDEISFAYRQMIEGHEEGMCLVAEHEEAIVAAIVAIRRPERNVIDIVDVRVDFDQRREGLATAMLFQATQLARETDCRAVVAEAVANNIPANRMLLKCGFDLNGLDTRRTSNHDLAREISTLLWYSALD